MWRLLFFFAMVTAAALGFAWLADRPGTVDIDWQGQSIHMSLMTLILGFLALLAGVMSFWWLVKTLLVAPGRLSRGMKQKNREKGLDAVSRGLIAVSAGDAELARKLASRAGRKLHSDGLAMLLKAQAAQLAGDRATARRLFEAMLESPETEVAGLRGLYLEARREKEMEAARQFAEKAVQRNPQLSWSSQALLEIQSRAGQWAEALKTLELARKHKKIDRKSADRQRAVLLTAQALEVEEGDADAALSHALEAHRLAPSLVPATEVAGRIFAAQGNVRRSAKVLLETWDLAPHPDLAVTYAFVRPGDSPRDRLIRVQQLAERTPHNMEGPIAVAMAAIESHDWKEARHALRGLLDERPTARVCTLMARIEGGEFGDKGRVREWLARAVKAPRDPAWTADGYISEHWAPVSPISGRLDAFEWKVPVEQLEFKEEDLTFDSFVPLAAEAEEQAETAVTAAPAIEVAPQTMAPSTPAPVVTPPAVAPASAPAPEPPASATADTTPPKAAAPTADASAAKAPPATIIVEAEPLDEPVRFGSQTAAEAPPAAPAVPTAEAAKTTEPKREARKKVEVREQPDIFIPPRLPDDPGPLDTDPLPGNARLPQRFRQST